jgi:three-Cys-motif partner protein
MPKKTHFHQFEPHTLTKHAVLDAYLKMWATILAPKFRQIWFIDAFAGEGRDNIGNPGSPLIAAKVAQQINEKHFASGISATTGMRLIAFEEDDARYPSLVETMKPYIADPWWKGVAIVREGSLEDSLAGVLQHVGDRPTLFFLDPFGIDGLSASVLPQLLSGQHNEILLLFSDVGAVRLAGKTRVGLQDENAMIAAAAASVPTTLFGDADTERQRDAARKKAKRSAAGHKSNPNAEEIMNTAFGGDWWQSIIFGTPDSLWQEKSIELYEDVLARSGASYRLRFSVDASNGQHKYFLIHASKNHQAYAAMKDAMHRAKAKRAADLFGEPQTAPLFEQVETTTNLDEVAALIAREFMGKSGVLWGKTDAVGTVKYFAIHHTSLWLHECDALKRKLLSDGRTNLTTIGRPESPLSFDFPSQSDQAVSSTG